jgi:hypothetical protein
MSPGIRFWAHDGIGIGIGIAIGFGEWEFGKDGIRIYF